MSSTPRFNAADLLYLLTCFVLTNDVRDQVANESHGSGIRFESMKSKVLMFYSRTVIDLHFFVRVENGKLVSVFCIYITSSRRRMIVGRAGTRH